MKRVVISSFITLVVIGLISLAYFTFQRYSFIAADPLSAVPSSTLFFIESKNARQTFQKLASENLLSSLVGSDSLANEHLHLLDSLVSKNKEVKKMLDEKPIFISAHITKANNFDYLFLASVPTSWSDDNVEHFITESFHLEATSDRRIYENVTVHELPVSSGRNFSFAVSKGVFIGSFTSFLVDDAIRQLKNGASVNKSKAFSKIAGTSDKSQATLYINYISLGEFFSSFSSGGNTRLFNAFSSFARWSKLDGNIQSNGLTFHGSTASTDTSDYLATWRGQQPQKINVTDILPLRTALFIQQGFSNYPKYLHHLLFNTVYFEPPDQRTKLVSALEKKFHADFDKNLTGWIDNELSLVITEPGSSSFENSCYACIKAKSTSEALQDLALVQSSVNNKNTSTPYPEYRKHVIGYIDLGGLAPLFYGNFFRQISKFYYAAVGSYIVIANQQAALHSFIDDYEDNKILTSDPGFKNHLRNAERISNFFMYINFGRAKNIFHHYASDDFNAIIDHKKNVLNQFASFSFQLVNRNENVETFMQLSKGNEKINSANLLWAAQLDTTLTMLPFILSNPEKTKKFVAVQDEAKNLYLLDDAGNVVWKKTLPEKIISDFHLVDAYKNGQQQILFNTTTHLYLVDLNGNDYGNYPIQLPATATNGCEVVDFDQQRNYKIFIACSNRFVYAYEISGKPMTGWMFNQPVSQVTNPVQYIKTNTSDYLLIYNHQGNVYLLDKHGAIRSSLKQFFISKNNKFTLMPGDSLDEGHLVTTDTSGKILSLYFNGTIKAKSYGSQVPDHAFFSADVDGDGKYDYAFLNQNQLKVFRQDSSLIFNYVFEENVFPQIYSFSFTSSQPQLGVGCLAQNKFFVLDFSGQLSKGFPVKGIRASSISDWGNEGKKILVTSGADGTVYGYVVE